MNFQKGFHRLVLVISLGIAATVLCNCIAAYWSEYKFFLEMESGDPMFEHIPEDVFGKGYSLGWILIKNLFKSLLCSVGFLVGSYIFLYLFAQALRWTVRLTSWIIQWVYRGFKDDVKIRKRIKKKAS